MNRTFFFQKLFIFFSFFSFSQLVSAQFLQTIDATGNGPYTPQSLISNVFLGDGVDVTSINYAGSPRAVGYFSGGSQSVGIERGILLTTGFAAKPTAGVGPTDLGGAFASNSNGSNASDANLNALSSVVLRDVAVYTITFIPTSDTLRFRYCFASEEYPEYSCTQFNDIFGFFIQGPGYPTPTNIARVPGTNLPVAINNIHPFNNQNFPTPNPCQPFNAQYYNNNLASASQPVYDGFTDVFTAMAVVTPCQPYTIKLAIADAFDSAYDSGVFLEAKSFGTSALRVTVNTPSADGSIAEGCTPASISFTLGAAMTQNYPINFSTFGTAISGIDYQALPNNLVIPAGQTSITVPIAAFEDNLTEALETIAFDVQIDACNRDTVYLYIRDNPILPPMMQDTSICTAGSPILLDATVPVPAPQPPTFSNTQSVPIPDNYPAVESSINVAGVQPNTLGPGVVRSVCLNIAHGYDDDLDLFLISPGGQVLELSTDNGGSGDNYTNTCFTPSALIPINFPGPQAPASATPFTGNFQPEGPWSDLWDTPDRPTNGTWRLQATDDFQSFSGSLLDWSITFAPTYEVNYQWTSHPDINCLDCPSNLINPSISGTYTVLATDVYGCTATDDVYVEITSMSANANITNPISCFGSSDGTALVNVNIGGANTYQWDDPALQTGATLNNAGAGDYEVTITNAGGCTTTTSITFTQPPLLELSSSSQDANCFGETSGTAATQLNGGTSPYQYLWSNGSTLASLPAIGAGTYTLTVTDNNGCTAASSLTINQPSALQLSTNMVQNVSCFNGSNGQISVSNNGGIAPASFLWGSGQNTATISGLSQGTYVVTVTDGNGCTASLTQGITEPTVISAFATPKAVNCHGNSTGELHLDVNGGTPTYSANWQGPGGFINTGTDLTGLFAGPYQATITDLNGCTSTITATISEPAQLILDLPALSDSICFNASNGTASVTPSGGVAPFTYLWNAAGQTTASVSGLSAQQYQVTVTDSKGCTEVAITRVPQKAELNTFAQGTRPSCHNGTDGSATVASVFYGITPANLNSFSYAWSTTPIQIGITANQLVANQGYTVTVTDADGCSATHALTIGNPTLVVAAITGKNDVGCHGENTGWASARATGGSAPYTWLWSNGNTPTDSIGQGFNAGLIRVTITDANGCQSISTVNIDEPTQLKAQIQATHVKCFGGRSGTAIASASGGTGPYNFVWWNGEQTSSLEELEAGTFGLTVTDANGCTTPKFIEIIQPEFPLAASVEMIEPRCFGDQNGQIIFTPSGGTPPYRYALDNKPYSGSTIQIGLRAGTYLPKIIDANGCTSVLAPIDVTQKDRLEVDLGPDFTILLGQDTQLIAQVFNYNSNYHISWSQEDSIWLSCLFCPNPSVYSLEYPTYFEATVIDSLGCRASDQILISVNKPRRVHVPTAFSPNGDLVNDLLLVHGQQSSKVLLFRVYDRWGEMLYEASDFQFNDENIGWDGTFRGQPMDPGVYIWVMEVEYVDGAKAAFKGNTTLIR